MRRAVLALVLTLSSVLSATQQRPTFSSKTTLLTIDVTVLDRDGKPVPSLAAEDFEIKINGKAQPVRAVAFLEAPKAAKAGELAAAAPMVIEASGRRTAANKLPPGESRVFVIVADDVFFEAGDGKALFVSAAAFASRLPATDLVGYAATSGIGTVNPTTNRAPVLAALKKTVGQFTSPNRQYSDPPMIGVGEALQVEGSDTNLLKEIMVRECFDARTAQQMTNASVENLTRSNSCASAAQFRVNHIVSQVKAARVRQVQALSSVIESLKTVPGIKHVVYLTRGLPLTKEWDELVPVAKAAAAAGVEISTMVEEGDIDLSDQGSSIELEGGGTSPVSPGQAARRREDNKILLGAAQTMTDMAGGQFYRVIGQPRRFFDRVETTASAIYRVGVELPSDIPAGREVAVIASVKRPGVTALASRHASAPEPEVTVSVDEQIKAAVTNGKTLYGVPMSFGAIVRKGATPNQLEIGVTVEVPGAVGGPLNTMFGLVDPAGALKTGKRAVPAPAPGADYQIAFSMPVTAGNHSLRFAIADASGAVGSVTIPIAAKLATMGPLEASDLMTFASDDKGQPRLVAVEDIPAGVKNVTAMIELYAPTAAPPPGLGVKFTLANASGQTVAEKAGSINAGGAVIRADAPFDISALPIGGYALRADVTLSGSAIGTTSVALRKR